LRGRRLDRRATIDSPGNRKRAEHQAEAGYADCKLSFQILAFLPTQAVWPVRVPRSIGKP